MINQIITLKKDFAELRPLHKSDKGALLAIATDPEIWRFTPSRIHNEAELDQYLDNAFQMFEKNLRYPFVIRDLRTGAVAGSTSFGNYSAKDQRIEIGWTWLGRNFQGSGLNKLCKFLLLQYAFEELNCLRVELKTDFLNLQSRKAMRNIGFKEEGVLRSHTAMHDGRRRDTIYYSMLVDEWEVVKEVL